MTRELTAFDKAFINAEIDHQNKAKEKAAKKAYIADLVKQGVDKEIAKIMAKTFFENGIVRAL